MTSTTADLGALGWYKDDGSWLPAAVTQPGPACWSSEYARDQLDVHLGGVVGAVESVLHDVQPDQKMPSLVTWRGQAGVPVAKNEMLVRVAPIGLPKTWKCPSFTPRTIQQGVINSAVRAAVLLPDGRFVRNFGWTPRVCVAPEALRAYVDGAAPGIVALPALARVRLLRVYWNGPMHEWAVASNACARLDPTVSQVAARLVESLSGLAAADQAQDQTGKRLFELRSFAHCFMASPDETVVVAAGKLRMGSVAADRPQTRSALCLPVYVPEANPVGLAGFEALVPVAGAFAETVLHDPTQAVVASEGGLVYATRSLPGGTGRAAVNIDGVLLVNCLTGACCRVVPPVAMSLQPIVEQQPYGPELAALAARVAIVYGHRSHGDAQWVSHLLGIDHLLATLYPQAHTAASTLAARLPQFLLAGELPGFDWAAESVATYGADIVLQKVRVLPAVVHAAMRILAARQPPAAY